MRRSPALRNSINETAFATRPPSPCAPRYLRRTLAERVLPLPRKQPRDEVVEQPERHPPEDAIADRDAVDEQPFGPAGAREQMLAAERRVPQLGDGRRQHLHH